MEIKVTVNGKKFTSDVEPRTLLVHYVREVLNLTGTNVSTTVGPDRIILTGSAAPLSGVCTAYTITNSADRQHRHMTFVRRNISIANRVEFHFHSSGQIQSVD